MTNFTGTQQPMLRLIFRHIPKFSAFTFGIIVLIIFGAYLGYEEDCCVAPQAIREHFFFIGLSVIATLSGPIAIWIALRSERVYQKRKIEERNEFRDNVTTMIFAQMSNIDITTNIIAEVITTLRFRLIRIHFKHRGPKQSVMRVIKKSEAIRVAKVELKMHLAVLDCSSILPMLGDRVTSLHPRALAHILANYQNLEMNLQALKHSISNLSPNTRGVRTSHAIFRATQIMMITALDSKIHKDIGPMKFDPEYMDKVSDRLIKMINDL